MKLNINFINRALKKDGFVKIPNFLNQKDVGEFNAILSKIKSKKAKNKSFHKKAKIITNLHLKHKNFFKIIFKKEILNICKNYFKYGAYKRDENIFQFDHINSRILEGKNPIQDLHIDSRICGVDPPTAIQFFIYLDDTPKGNGTTRFVKGSHLIKKYPQKKDNKKSVSINCKKGDVIVLNSSVWHGSDKKTHIGKRTIITLAYSRWFLRQQFAIPFSLKSMKNKFSDKEKYLLGFYNYPAVTDKQRQGRRGPLPKY